MNEAERPDIIYNFCKENETFKDRIIATQAFKDSYNAVRNNAKSFDVISFYGVGGIGKSALCRHLMREMINPDFIPNEQGKDDIVLINLEQAMDKGTILYLISRQMMASSEDRKLKFPLFDAAYSQYLKALGKNPKQYLEEKKDALKNNHAVKIASLFLRKFNPISELNFISDVLKEVAPLAVSAVQKQRLLSGPNAAMFNNIALSSNDQLLDNLHIYFKRDLYEYMKERKRPFVIFIDGYENFVDLREKDVHYLLEEDAWVKNPDNGLVSIPNTLWVIAGRNQLHWDAQILPTDHMYRIGDLSEKDSDTYFEQVGISNNVLRKDLYKLTRGVPIFMDICAKVYHSISLTRTPVFEDFCTETISESSMTSDRALNSEYLRLMAALAKKYLDLMPDEMVKMLYILVAMPNSWDRELAEEVADSIRYGACTLKLDAIIKMSLIEQANDEYKLHETFRTVISNFDNGIIPKAQNTALKVLAQRIMSASSEAYIQNTINKFVEVFTSTSKITLDEGTLLGVFDIIAGEYKNSGDYNDCEKKFKAVTVHCAETGSSPRVAVHCNNIRNNNLHKLGHVKELDRQTSDTLRYAEERLDSNDKYRITAMHYRAVCHYDMGEYQKALELYQKCYEARARVLGETDRTTLRSLNNLAVCCSNVGDYGKALELYRRCNENYAQTLAPNHPDVLMSLNNLAAGYYFTGDYKNAEELYTRCYDMRKSGFNPNNPDNLHTLNNIGVLYNDIAALCEDSAEYEAACQRAIAKSEECYQAHVLRWGETHPDTLHSLNNLAVCYSGIGEYDKALEKKKECHNGYEKALGAEHPDTLRSLNNLAVGYYMTGDTEKAIELLTRCYEARERVLGEDHPDTVSTLESLETAKKG